MNMNLSDKKLINAKLPPQIYLSINMEENTFFEEMNLGISKNSRIFAKNFVTKNFDYGKSIQVRLTR